MAEEPKETKPGFMNPVAGFGVTFKAMFKKRLTEQYPEQKKTTAPRFHGRHQLNRHPDGLEKCVGCELCAWACPAVRRLSGGCCPSQTCCSGRLSHRCSGC